MWDVLKLVAYGLGGLIVVNLLLSLLAVAAVPVILIAAVALWVFVNIGAH